MWRWVSIYCAGWLGGQAALSNSLAPFAEGTWSPSFIAALLTTAVVHCFAVYAVIK